MAAFRQVSINSKNTSPKNSSSKNCGQSALGIILTWEVKYFLNFEHNIGFCWKLFEDDKLLRNYLEDSLKLTW